MKPVGTIRVNAGTVQLLLDETARAGLPQRLRELELKRIEYAMRPGTRTSSNFSCCHSFQQVLVITAQCIHQRLRPPAGVGTRCLVLFCLPHASSCAFIQTLALADGIRGLRAT